MKCPKCGYNSFDYLDSCKKCNKDLTEHKARFNIQSILLSEMATGTVSTAADEIVASATATAGSQIDDFATGGTGEDADDFGFDFMGDSEDDENLEYDELFEDVPSEDNVEETLPDPGAPTKADTDGAKAEFAAGEEDADDFGFGFMGDSDDNENLAFDELFEDATPEDEVEEALPAPEAPAKPSPLDAELARSEASLEQKKTKTSDFSFDEAEPASRVKETVKATPDNTADFGFDAEDDPAADIFAETEEDFSLDGIDFEDSDKK